MIDLHHYEGFCTVHNDTSFESQMVYMYCFDNDLKVKKVNNNVPCPDTHVPSGSIEWCLLSLGRSIEPDYYPEWLTPHLHRKVWKADKWVLGDKLFVKPADRHKRFTGFTTFGTYSKKKKGPYWYSEIVHFENEWRYYVTKGKILCGHWYAGDEINTPDAPVLDIEVPDTFSGTLDFGTLSDGSMALVEAHEPFACGWYGNKADETYLQWIVDGWKYLQLN